MDHNESNMQKRAFVSLTDAASRLGVHPNTLRAACKRGEFPHVRIGRAIRISCAKLEEIERTGAASYG